MKVKPTSQQTAKKCNLRIFDANGANDHFDGQSLVQAKHFLFPFFFASQCFAANGCRCGQFCCSATKAQTKKTIMFHHFEINFSHKFLQAVAKPCRFWNGKPRTASERSSLPGGAVNECRSQSCRLMLLQQRKVIRSLTKIGCNGEVIGKNRIQERIHV